MKPIILRRSALADLESLAAYFDAIDPDVTARIIADVERSIARLADFPSSGEAIPGTGLRRIVSRRYRFTVSYFAHRIGSRLSASSVSRTATSDGLSA